MKNISWDAFQIFLAVARHGGLTGASQVAGFSPATIGRRVLDLEQQIGRPLFHRSQIGYQLTAEGEALFERLQEMEASVRMVEDWRREARGTVTARIAAGTWIARLLCENIGAICSERDPFRLEFQIAERRARLAHREADIGVRAFRPEEPNLASRAMPDVSYALYRAKAARPSDQRLVAVDEEEAISAYLQWPHQQADRDIAFTVTRPTALFDLIIGGAGCGVLPCFIGDRDPRLERLGAPIKALQHSQWLVMNADDRHRREIRTVIDRIAKQMKDHAVLFGGRLAHARS